MLGTHDAIADQIGSLEQTLAGGDARIDGHVRLTAPEMLSPYLVNQLAGYRERYPEITVELHGADRKLDVMAGEADLAIRGDKVEDSELVARKLIDVGIALWASHAYVARKGTPASAEDLTGHDVIAFGTGLDYAGAQWLEQRLTGATVVLRAHTMHGVHDAAVEGLGLTAMPCLPYMDRRLQRLGPAISSRPLYLAIHPDLVRVARVRTVIDFLADLFDRDRELFA